MAVGLSRIDAHMMALTAALAPSAEGVNPNQRARPKRPSPAQWARRRPQVRPAAGRRCKSPHQPGRPTCPLLTRLAALVIIKPAVRQAARHAARQIEQQQLRPGRGRAGQGGVGQHRPQHVLGGLCVRSTAAQRTATQSAAVRAIARSPASHLLAAKEPPHISAKEEQANHVGACTRRPACSASERGSAASGMPGVAMPRGGRGGQLGLAVPVQGFSNPKP